MQMTKLMIRTLPIPIVLGLALNAVTIGLEPDGPPPYIPHPPIKIEGEEDLTPENGVTGGTGTAEDPYLISGWSITAPYHITKAAIWISNLTAVYVSIEDNLITGRGGGDCVVIFENVISVTAKRNDFLLTNSVICAFRSQHLTVSNNSFVSLHPGFNLAAHAVVLWNTHDSQIIDNTISGYWGGMNIRMDSDRNLIKDNLFEDNGNAGAVYILEDSEENVVSKNTIRDGPGVGIQIYSDDNKVFGNTIRNLGHGIMSVGRIPFVTGLQIHNNHLENLQVGLGITCSECEFTHNTIRDSHEVAFGRGGEDFVWSHNVIESSGRLSVNEFHARNNSFPHEQPFRIVTQEQSDLRYNWWGSPSGPQEDVVTGTDLISPWLTAPPPGLP